MPAALHPRLLIRAVLLGAASGLVCVACRRLFALLQWILVRNTDLLPHAAAALPPLHRFLIPVAGAAIAAIVLALGRRFLPGPPPVEYVEAIRLHHGRIPLRSAFNRIMSSAWSIASGAAIGREGSMIQFASAVTSTLATRVPPSPLRAPRHTIPLQVACGAAAAVASVYQAPLAAIFFATEIILGSFSWAALPALALASVTGWLVSGTLLARGPLFPVPHPAASSATLLHPIPLAQSLLLALALACIGPLYQLLLRSLTLLRRIPAALLIGGFACGLLSLRSPLVWGNGDVALATMLTATPLLSFVLITLALRLTATTICVGAGTVGGVFTPTLYAGAALGLLAARLLHASHPVLFAVLGVTLLMAAVTHAPIMAACMAAELTGLYTLLPAFLVLATATATLARRISPRHLYAIATPSPTSPHILGQP